MPIVVLDGPDGSGKSTQAFLLRDYLAIDKKLNVELFQMPGATELGKEIRRIVKSKQYPTDRLTERLLFAADVVQFFAERLEPALADGKIVLMDRWAPITDLIYACASGINLHWMGSLQGILDISRNVDVYIPFRINPEISMQRKFARAAASGEECRIEDKGREFMLHVTQLYNALGTPESESTTQNAQLFEMITRRCLHMRPVDADAEVLVIKNRIIKILEETFVI